jgi:hypothetical protein
MTTSWKITHDPLRLMETAAVFAVLEEDAREQGEDIIQAERQRPGKKKEVLDLGWYQDRYLVFLIEDADWESPIQKIEYRDLGSAMLAFRTLAV